MPAPVIVAITEDFIADVTAALLTQLHEEPESPAEYELWRSDVRAALHKAALITDADKPAEAPQPDLFGSTP